MSIQKNDIVRVDLQESKLFGKRFKVLSVDGPMVEVERGMTFNERTLAKKVNGRFLTFLERMPVHPLWNFNRADAGGTGHGDISWSDADPGL